MLPALPLEEWEQTKNTFHRYLQIIGKIKMSIAPKRNHWWHIVLHTYSRGLTTRSIPYKDTSFEISLDLIAHECKVICSTGMKESFQLFHGLSVKDFYGQLTKCLENIGVVFRIKAEPYDLSDSIPFTDDTQHSAYDSEYVSRFWNILLWVDKVFTKFSGRAYCKTSPVNIYWHHMDIAVTRFNGNRGPNMPDANQADQEAYSHEVISFGFWAGDDTVREPAFYSYTYPAPSDIDKEPLSPELARWVDSNGSPMATLMYNDLCTYPDPEDTLLSFMQSAYDAGAKLANWNVEEV